jgi:hypothetical protein
MSALLWRALPRRAAVFAAAAGLCVTGFATTTSSTASAVSSTPAATAIHFALAQLGKPYSWGGNGPGSYDCSGLTSAAYRAAGITIPRVSRDQYRLLPRVPKSQWRPGDLIFFASDTHDASTIHHVAIFMGAGWMLDAPHEGTVVQIQPIHSGLMRYAARPAGVDSTPLLAVTEDTTGYAVRDLQKRLRANGYMDVSVTGTYDDATKAAVAAMREAYDLPGGTYIGWRFWHLLVVNGRHRSLPQ